MNLAFLSLQDFASVINVKKWLKNPTENSFYPFEGDVVFQ